MWQDWSKGSCCSDFLTHQQFLAEFKDAPVMGSVVLSEPDVTRLVDLFQAMTGMILGFLG